MGREGGALGETTYLVVLEGQIVQTRVDQIDCLITVGALSDDGEEDDGEGSGDELDGGEGAAAWRARRLEVKRYVGRRGRG